MRAVLLILGLAWIAGCAPPPRSETGRLQVVTTILPVHALTLAIAGEHAEVRSVLATAAAAHDFQMTPKERRLIENAGLVVINGLGMESWLTRTLKDFSRTRQVVECTAGLEGELIHDAVDEHEAADHHHAGSAHRHGAANPHLWLDPVLASRMVTNILAALQQADPPRAAAYATNAAACVTRLELLDREIRLALAPLTNRTLVTYHRAFPYFARRYDLKVVGVIQETPEVAPSPRHLADLRQIVRSNDVKAIFTEPGHSDKLARQLALDWQLRLAPLDTLETGDFTPGAYEDGMRKNLRALLDALK
jgi:zinc transport system substrate-binding protein